jgi:hypothetical protein
MKAKSKNNKINLKVIIYSFIALGCIALSFLVDWIFMAGAVLMIWLNQRELVKG